MKISYPVAGVVSVWIGTFETEMDFDQCVDRAITEALNLPTDLVSVSEVCYEEDPVSVRKLLEGFSGWESFIEATEYAAKAKGLSLANAAVVCYSVKCEKAAERWDDLHFLGTFAGQDVL